MPRILPVLIAACVAGFAAPGAAAAESDWSEAPVQVDRYNLQWPEQGAKFVEPDFVLPCSKPRIQSALLNGGFFRIVIQRLSTSNADIALRIYDVTAGRTPLFLDEMTPDELAPAATEKGAFSRRVWATFDATEKPQCPALRFELVTRQAGGASPVANIWYVVSSYRPQEQGLLPQGEITEGASGPVKSKLNSITDGPTKAAIQLFAKSVALVEYGLSNCTGVLVAFLPPNQAGSAPRGRLLTNWHCVRDEQRASRKCDDTTVFFNAIAQETRRQWRCDSVAFLSEPLDAAVLDISAVDPDKEVGSGLSVAPLPQTRNSASSDPDPADKNAVLLLHHASAKKMQLSQDCFAPRAPGVVERYSMGIQDIGRNDATLIHGCNSDAGSSGAPLIRRSAGGDYVMVGLHFSNWTDRGIVRDEACYMDFLRPRGEVEKGNFAFDAFDVRCALEKEKIIPPSTVCRNVATPANLERLSKTELNDRREEWSKYYTENCSN
jgi:hypothetical protein